MYIICRYPHTKRNMTIDENVEEMKIEFPDKPLHKLVNMQKKDMFFIKQNKLVNLPGNQNIEPKNKTLRK
jgi:hypothetical protein